MTSRPFVPFADCAEVVLKGLCGGANANVTFGVKKTSTLDDGDLETIMSIFDEWWQTNLRGSVGDDFVLQTIKVTNLNSQFAGTFEGPPSDNPGGAVTGTIAPNNAAYVMSLKTARRGRAFRGRNYIPAIPSANLQDAQHVTTASATALAAAYVALALLLQAEGFIHVVLSRWENKVYRTTGEATPVQTYIAREKIGTMRRRIDAVS